MRTSKTLGFKDSWLPKFAARRRELRKQVAASSASSRTACDQDCSLEPPSPPLDHEGIGAGAGAGSIIIGAGFGAAGFLAALLAGFFALFFAM